MTPPEGQRFRINIAWNPDENWEPEWVEMTRGEYFEEWSADEETLQEMIEKGAALPLPEEDKGETPPRDAHTEFWNWAAKEYPAWNGRMDPTAGMMKHAFLASWSALAESRAEVEMIKQDAADLAVGKVTLYDLAIRNGTLTAEVGSEMCQILAAQFGELLKERGGENYMEMHLSSERHEGETLVVTLKWEKGKSPHELRQIAESELTALREENGRLREMDWKPIDGAPKDRLVDVWTGVDRIPNCKWSANEGAFCSNYGRGMAYRTASHFKSFPAAPERGDG